MQNGPSHTAVVTAMHRAAHVALDDAPHILADTFACAFAGYTSDAELLDAFSARSPVDSMRMRTLFALRSRYAEDELARPVGRGIRQYIILGAGLDSFAYRRPASMAAVNVFKIDHPASQAWKRARVAELGIAQPKGLHHIPIDFERDTFGDGLAESDVELDEPVFLSWLGTTQYLSENAVLLTLRDIASVTAAGSEIVLQFVLPPATLAANEAALVRALASRAAAIGEPWLSFFEPAEIASHLRDAGFGTATHFDHRQATERYLSGRSDGLSVPAYLHMIHARLGSALPANTADPLPRIGSPHKGWES